MTEELKNEFLNKFPVPVGDKENPYIILFDAYSGMGKTTVSRKIAEYEDVVILNNDEVRHFINDLNDKTDLKNKLQAMRLEMLISNHNNCICDSSFSHEYERKLEFIKKLKCSYYIVRLICDEDVVKERMDKRVLDDVNYSLATYKGHLWMKENVPLVPDDLIDFVIYTDQDIEGQVQEFIKYIKEN